MNKMPISDIRAIADGAMDMDVAYAHRAMLYGGGEGRYSPHMTEGVDYILIVADDFEPIDQVSVRLT